jgi:hypothetical protein
MHPKFIVRRLALIPLFLGVSSAVGAIANGNNPAHSLALAWASLMILWFTTLSKGSN